MVKNQSKAPATLPYAIHEYYKSIQEIKVHSKNEKALANPFFTLVEHYLKAGNTLVQEVRTKNLGGDTIIPDATIYTRYRLSFGHIENKAKQDNLKATIKTKIIIGYPLENTIFQDSETLLLYQDGQLVLEIPLSHPAKLNHALQQFVGYKSRVARDFEQSLQKFREDVPYLVEVVNNTINLALETNNEFHTKIHALLKMFKESINPYVQIEDITEVLVQHILTEDIFTNIIGNSHFHQNNVVAKSIQELVALLGYQRQEIHEELQNYYKPLAVIVKFVQGYEGKQSLLKVIYENFYKGLNPKKADRHGIVYTPLEVVNYMVKFTDFLMNIFMKKQLANEGVEILDPATGTGIFITSVLDHLQYYENFVEKYQNEIHCNEIDILPYYIANINIENIFHELARKNHYLPYNKFIPFNNICLTDTLEVVGKETGTGDLLTFTDADSNNPNLARIKEQKSKKITIIIGNPPYNAHQQSENHNNKNKLYKEIDAKIKNTYVKESKAQNLNTQYDMYKRFIRWSSDRIGEEGIVSFVCNHSFIDSRQDDGFRKQILIDFDFVYVYDLKGNARLKEKAQGGSVFGIQTGVAMVFLIRVPNNRGYPRKGKIYYKSCPDFISGKEKLALLNSEYQDSISHSFDGYMPIIPDSNNNWLNQSTTNFASLIPLVDKNVKNTALKTPNDNKLLEAECIFKMFSLGVSTNRDDWVYDFNKKQLTNKVQLFINKYNQQLEKLKNYKFESNKELDNAVDYSIKWSEGLKNSLKRKLPVIYDTNKLVPALYRPFVVKSLYFDSSMLERQYQSLKIFPENTANTCINVHIKTGNTLCAKYLASLDFLGASGNIIIPISYYLNSKKYENITNWGLKRFQENYKNSAITKEDIFYYCYGVLNNPNYQEKYNTDLKKSYPRIPFYKDFTVWKNWGKKLADLHINFTEIPPADVNIVELNNNSNNEPILKLKKDKDADTHTITLDATTLITNIPYQAVSYKLGGKSAIAWVLNGYAPKKLNPQEEHHKTLIDNKLNQYNWLTMKAELLNLLPKIINLSVQTSQIHTQMIQESSQEET